MRWKISQHGHDPRQLDLLAIVALLIAIIVAALCLADHATAPANKTAFIEPSQSVRW